jgi:hypothetical protein
MDGYGSPEDVPAAVEPRRGLQEAVLRPRVPVRRPRGRRRRLHLHQVLHLLSSSPTRQRSTSETRHRRRCTAYSLSVPERFALLATMPPSPSPAACGLWSSTLCSALNVDLPASLSQSHKSHGQGRKKKGTDMQRKLTLPLCSAHERNKLTHRGLGHNELRPRLAQAHNHTFATIS